MQIPTYTIRRAARPPRIDGAVADSEWQRAAPIALVRNDSGEPPRFPTEARMLWDDANLYVSFVCQDPDIWGSMTERDASIYDEEVVELFIDDDSSGTDYFEFEVSPLNVTLDLLIAWRDGKMHGDRSWDCGGWRTAVQVRGTVNQRADTDEQWSVEMAIPWKGLRPDAPHLPPKLGDRMRMNLYRIERAQDGNEFSAWSPTGKPSFHAPQRFGQVVFGE